MPRTELEKQRGRRRVNILILFFDLVLIAYLIMLLISKIKGN